MGASNTTLTERLETALGARVMSLASMPVGFGLRGFKVDLDDGRRLAVKLREGSAHADLSLEAYMLSELARHSDLPVPAVHLSGPDLLAMDFIETDGSGVTARVERHAAELIAALHATPRPCFGYERDTLIGPLPQPNPEMDRWIPFFATSGCSPQREQRKRKEGYRRGSSSGSSAWASGFPTI
jgi:fructosamine-3-kinase